MIQEYVIWVLHMINIRTFTLTCCTGLRFLKHAKEIGIILSAYFLYMFVRKFIIPDVESIAMNNAISLISLESNLGLLWEHQLQMWAVGPSSWIIRIFNWAYVLGFFPLILTTALVIYIKDRSRYFYYRNVVLISLVLALMVFVAFPLAPPRFLTDYGFVDGFQSFGPTWYGRRDMAIYYNINAAMPSLHFGWTLLFGILYIRTKLKFIKPIGIIYPVIMFFAVTISGNHYVLDSIAGAGVILIAYLGYELFLWAKSSYKSIIWPTRRFSPTTFVRPE